MCVCSVCVCVCVCVCNRGHSTYIIPHFSSRIFSMISQSSIDQSPPEYHSHDTHTWYSTHGLVAFATSLDWDGVQRLNSDFSRDTCHHFGKAKDVLRQETSVVAQGQGGGWFHKYVSLQEVSAGLVRCCQPDQ